MLVIKPLSAVTKVPIEVCAPVVSLPTVSVVGVPAARRAQQIEGDAADDRTHPLLALVAAKPLTVKFASVAAWVWVRLVTPCGGIIGQSRKTAVAARLRDRDRIGRAGDIAGQHQPGAGRGGQNTGAHPRIVRRGIDGGSNARESVIGRVDGDRGGRASHRNIQCSRAHDRGAGCQWRGGETGGGREVLHLQRILRRDGAGGGRCRGDFIVAEGRRAGREGLRIRQCRSASPAACRARS